MAVCLNDNPTNRQSATNCCGGLACPQCPGCPSGFGQDQSVCQSFGCDDGFGALRTCYKNASSYPSDTTSLLACCLGTTQQTNCKPGFCLGSADCATFLTNYCQGANLETAQCVNFCQTNPGACDTALRTFCALPANFTETVCGCSLPSGQYLLTNLKTPQGLAVPITCDQRCANSGAVKLAGQQECAIGTICVQSGINITTLQSQVGKITLEQNCSSGGSGGTSSISSFFSSLFSNKNSSGGSSGGISIGLIIVIVIVLIIIIVVIVLIVRANNKNKANAAGGSSKNTSSSSQKTTSSSKS
jgi:hypothetical protein